MASSRRYDHKDPVKIIEKTGLISKTGLVSKSGLIESRAKIKKGTEEI